ncbi:carbohydrate ABC transporter permease [Paenibacillus psychroresistens]|uniref:Carbohydrate ABC transporter permease n=1 Tax=Paenibacillus psychroresistens TaxID=1778678 RepID=A0A6B8RUV4_9BACL|nr:carbohydrate ABC transporter permease [Paenibacillus psychroresistens]QGQ99415.1 carbohydrate ABC transporter permease [Paenibacillus psychroresistens]
MTLKKRNRKILFSLSEAVMILLSIVVMLPFYFTLLNSLKSSGEAAMLNFAWPAHLHFDNYLTVFKEANIFRGLKNSAIVSLSSVLLLLLLASITAFIIDRRQSATTKFSYNYFVLGIIPSGFLIPTIYTLKSVGLYGTYLGLDLIYVAGGAPIAIFLLTGFIKTVPRELDESAIMDGVKVLRLFFVIILPQLKPIVATTFIFNFLGIWNDFVGPLVYLTNSKQYTIPMSVYVFNSLYNTEWEKVFSVLLISTLPVIFAYAIAQKYIVEGMTAGAVKG